MVTFRASNSNVMQQLAAPGGVVDRAMRNAAQQLVNQAKRNLSTGATKAVDTGRLRASIGYDIRIRPGKLVARVGTDVSYAAFVHEGTPRGNPGGIIRPRRAKVLRFPPSGGIPQSRVSGDGFVYARQVRGMKPRPFLTEALKTIRPHHFRV